MLSLVATRSSLTPMQSIPQPRLVKAAHEFEAQLMKEILKPLTAGGGLTGSDDDSGSTGALGDYAGESLGRALSEQGGFGIADSIIAQVSQSGNRPAPAPVIGNPHADTAASPHK
jgi:Rod binding domain-containing protein